METALAVTPRGRQEPIRGGHLLKKSGAFLIFLTRRAGRAGKIDAEPLALPVVLTPQSVDE